MRYFVYIRDNVIKFADYLIIMCDCWDVIRTRGLQFGMYILFSPHNLDAFIYVDVLGTSFYVIGYLYYLGFGLEAFPEEIKLISFIICFFWFYIVELGNVFTGFIVFKLFGDLFLANAAIADLYPRINFSFLTLPHFLYLIYNIRALQYMPKHHIVLITSGRIIGSDIKLRGIRIWLSTVGHR